MRSHGCLDELRVHVINFNQKQLTLEKKLIVIKTPVYKEHIAFRDTHFDALSGQIVHIVQRRLEKKLVYDIYHINIVDFMKLDKFDKLNKLAISLKEKDLKFVYITDRFNEVTCKMFPLNGNSETNALLLTAFYSEETGEGSGSDDDSSTGIYHPRACLDIVHLKGGKIWFVRKILIKFEEMPGFLTSTTPYTHFTEKGILFYQETCDEMKNKTLSVQEFDCKGKHKFSYVIPYPGMVYCFQTYGSYIFLYAKQKSQNPRSVDLIKLEEGQIKTIEKINDALIFPGNPSDNFWYRLKPSFKRFDRVLLPIHATKRNYNNFTTMDLTSKQKVTEITDFGLFSPKCRLNWNINEIGMTFFYNNDTFDENFRGKMYFKIYRSSLTNEMLSLKHLARLAVLTNFSEGYLVKQNLPPSLFNYLCVKKKQIV